MNYTDTAITTADHDHLDFGQYCQVLTNVVAQAETPLTVGIFGPWGSGKTSLMKLVQESLVKAEPPPITVWFNAWKYDQEEALWRALIIQVLGALRPKPKETEPAERSQYAADKPDSPQFTAGEEALIKELDDLEASLYRPVEREEVGGVHVDWEQLLRGSVLGVTQLSLSFLPGVGALLGKGLEKAEEALTGKELNTIFGAIQRERHKIYRAHIQSLEQFQGRFQELIQKQVVDNGQRLVVFIDDLDRCLPEKAIEVLEAVKLFLDVPGCLFFLGVDRGVIEQGIRVKYKDFLEAVNAADGGKTDTLQKDRRIPITGDDYLEKIVQLPFHLLPLDEARVREFIEKSGVELPDGCADIFAAGLEANPRKVKRALNIFRLLHQLAELRRDEFKVDDRPLDLQPQLLAKVVVIQSRYRELYNEMVETPLLLPELEAVFTDKQTSAADNASTPSQPLPDRGRSKNLPPAGGRPAGTPTDSTGSGETTLLDKYRASRQLRRLLRAGTVFFAKPSLAEVKLYLYLTTTAESGQNKASDPAMTRWWQQLLSNDPTKIRSAAAELRTDLPEAWTNIINRLELESLPSNPDALLRIASIAALAYSHDEMLNIAPGEYQVGTRDSWRWVEGFKINRYPVTNAWYKLFLDANGNQSAPDGWQERWYPAGKGSQPVIGVNWNEAQAFCRWAGKRLPKDDEWLITARQHYRTDFLREWVAAGEDGKPLVMPTRIPEQAESKQPDLSFRVAE